MEHIYDLHNELAILRRLRNDLLSLATTPEESASIAPQLVNVTKEIESLVKACLHYKLESGGLLDKETAASLVTQIVKIISEELSALPDFGDLEQSAVNITGKAETVNLIRALKIEYPDRYAVIDNVAARIGSVVAGWKNEQPPSATN